MQGGILPLTSLIVMITISHLPNLAHYWAPVLKYPSSPLGRCPSSQWPELGPAVTSSRQAASPSFTLSHPLGSPSHSHLARVTWLLCRVALCRAVAERFIGGHASVSLCVSVVSVFYSKRVVSYVFIIRIHDWWRVLADCSPGGRSQRGAPSFFRGGGGAPSFTDRWTIQPSCSRVTPEPIQSQKRRSTVCVCTSDYARQQ